MNLVKFTFLSLLALGLPAAGLQAQAIVLKGGVRINAGSFGVSDGKITQKVKLSNGKEAESSVPLESIDHMEWPEVREVLEAQTLLAEGKTKEALEELQSAKDYFKPFKAIKGNPYNEISFAHVEALDQAGDFDTLIRTLPEVDAMKWDDEHKLKLKLVKLNMQRRTSSDQEAVLSEAEDLLSETDDAAICARLWMTIADIHVKRKRWEEALMAYLHVPVFYGSQGNLVPQAELSAARALAKLERFKDAVGFYERIEQQYAGSETAATAKNERLPINGLENKPDKPPGSQKPGDQKNSEKKSESTTEAKTESK
jgi:tetratricopeptide (TPR) repeat protein